ncbi:MAG: hypothetical protein ACFB4J_02600 [Elainellaceae cyanobacterium]
MATRNARDPHFIKIRDNKFVQLQLKSSSYSAGLQTTLGIQDNAPGDAADIVGYGRDDAFENGCVPVRLVYEARPGKLQSVGVLCSPSNADTVFAQAVGQTYNGKRIVKVRFPRRRVYRYG